MQKEKRGSLLSHDDRRRILEHFEEENRKVAKRYFNRDQLFSMDVDYPQIILNENEVKDRYIEILENLILDLSYKVFYPSLIQYLNRGKRIAFFGAGYMCKRIVCDFGLPAEVIIDNDRKKTGQVLEGIPIVWAGDITDWKGYLVLITPINAPEIVDQLKKLGLQENTDFMNIHTLGLW